MTVDALAFFGAMITLLWLALAVAVGAVVLAAIWVMSRVISRRLEGRYLPGLSRWSRRRSGLPEDAGPWACPGCRSVNTSTVVACYRCGVARLAGAPELREAATDPGIFHRPAPENQFDPSRYRGPGGTLPALPASSPSPEPQPAPPPVQPASAEPPSWEAP